MKIESKIVLDSINSEGIRLTTIHAKYPRMIHSEIMTHRVFSRNGRSSRAVPVATLLKEEPYLPEFRLNQPGMVAGNKLAGADLEEANKLWLDLAEETKRVVARLRELNVHKEHANRPLEWFGWIDVLISSTDWANFFALRDEVGAQPEIRSVAQCIRQNMNDSKPRLLKPGEWHLPYITTEDHVAIRHHLDEGWKGSCAEFDDAVLDLLRKISTARCARLSYKAFDGDGSIEKELARYERLVVSRPVHGSPAEHIARCERICDGSIKHLWGNFYGWVQYRQLIPFNTIKDR